MNDTTVVPLRQPETVDDPLTAVLRNGARRLLAQAIEAEADAFLASMKEMQLPDGRDRLVRHGHGPERLVQTGIGAVAVRRVKLRDRGMGAAGERIRFTSAILPRWARRTRSLDALLVDLKARPDLSGDRRSLLRGLEPTDQPRRTDRIHHNPQLGKNGECIGPLVLQLSTPAQPAQQCQHPGRCDGR